MRVGEICGGLVTWPPLQIANDAASELPLFIFAGVDEFGAIAMVPTVERDSRFSQASSPLGLTIHCNFVTRFDRFMNFNFRTPPEARFFTLAQSLRAALGVNGDDFAAIRKV